MLMHATIDLALPPPELMTRVSGSSDAESFVKSGARSVEEWGLALSVARKKIQDFDIIMDFGAGCGRAVRHVKPMLRENQRLIAADIDGEAIGWIASNIPGVEAITLNDRPPSPVADASVDLVLNHSVFTHLPEELQTLWLDDLRRILKPGGLILATFHGRKTTESFRSRIKEAGFPDQAEDFARTYERDGFIYRAGRSEYESKLPEYYASAFHTIGYVERVWFPGFDCLAWLPEFALGHQDVVILRRH